MSASSEIFQKRVSQALEGLDGILNITDDVLIYGVGDTEDEAIADHDRKLRITEVPFMGHIFSKDGLKIDPNKAKAALEMTRPEDVEGVQRLNRFVNYLAKFLPRLADHMEPIRRLTRQDTEFNWTEEQEKAFREVKHWSSATTTPRLSSKYNVMPARQALEQPSCKEEDRLHIPAGRSQKPSNDMHRSKRKCLQSSSH